MGRNRRRRRRRRKRRGGGGGGRREVEEKEKKREARRGRRKMQVEWEGRREVRMEEIHVQGILGRGKRGQTIGQSQQASHPALTGQWRASIAAWFWGGCWPHPLPRGPSQRAQGRMRSQSACKGWGQSLEMQ